MRFQSFIRQCKAGRDCMQGGSTLYTFHVTEQGVTIGVLDSRDGMSDSQAGALCALGHAGAVPDVAGQYGSKRFCILKKCTFSCQCAWNRGFRAEKCIRCDKILQRCCAFPM